MLRARKNQFSLPMLAMAALGLASGAARAATAGDIATLQVLNTSPLWADSLSYHACNVVNVTTSAVNVIVELINGAGTIVAGSANAISIPAGTTFEISDASGNGTTDVGFARCRFTVNFTPITIRANETIFHSLGGGNFQTYATSEAR